MIRFESTPPPPDAPSIQTLLRAHAAPLPTCQPTLAGRPRGPATKAAAGLPYTDPTGNIPPPSSPLLTNSALSSALTDEIPPSSSRDSTGTGSRPSKSFLSPAMSTGPTAGRRDSPSLSGHVSFLWAVCYEAHTSERAEEGVSSHRGWLPPASGSVDRDRCAVMPPAVGAPGRPSPKPSSPARPSCTSE